ncbi:MAG: glycosyl hydrolase [Verrucomicrobiia bacterium]
MNRHIIKKKLLVNSLFVSVCLVLFLAAQKTFCSDNDFISLEKTPFAWIEPDKVAKPWSYWWWMGSAVDEQNISRELERLKKAGWGGVHIIPIYGAKGWENRYIEYLSPQWLKMLDFTIKKADELGLQVDMTLGTGWCFGGPSVTDDEANARLIVRTNIIKTGGVYSAKFEKQKIQRIMAFEKSGEIKDLTSILNSDGTIEWRPAQGEWTIYALYQQPSGQKVKRAAPGGVGHMLNLIYPTAVSNYLKWFDSALSSYNGRMPRAVYHDSYEYRSEWTPDFFEQFYKLRGYRLEEYLPYLLRRKDGEISKRVIADYRQTVSDIMVEQSLPLWVEWAHRRGMITRNEAHGSPANLLDLYAVADIPETEMFYRDRNTLISKLASSAAHVSGKKLTSAETGTWLKEHFHETLKDIKELVDQMFVSGVNHIFFHGTCYSPDEAPWPGWLFYASTQMNPRNSIWRDAPALAQYISKCQAILQYGEPANDILLYYPFPEIWQKLDGFLPHFTIHGLNWFEGIRVSNVASQLWSNGYSFDYISDRQLRNAQVIKGQSLYNIITEGKTEYKILIIPACEYLPDTTLKDIMRLAESGAIVIIETLPADVPGFYNLDQRRENFKRMLKEISSRQTELSGVAVANIGMGKIFVGDVITALKLQKSALPHFISKSGNLEYIARRNRAQSGDQNGEVYQVFVVNRNDRPLKGWFDTGWQLQSAVLMNPMSGIAGIASLKTTPNSSLIYLELAPYESAILRLFKNNKVDGERYKYFEVEGDGHQISGAWRVEFVDGGPVLPPSLTLTNLESWTNFNGDDYKRFAGTAKYSIKFDLPENRNGLWMIDFGQVCQSARVKINGKEIGVLFSNPFSLICYDLKPKGNLLEVEVTNLSANRIRDLDRRKVQWKIFNDINIVNINYKPFDASDWELVDSGLLGPVKIFKVVEKKAQN